MFISHSSMLRNGSTGIGNGITCTGSSDDRIEASYLQFNGGYGFRGINCNSPRIEGANDISANQNGGIYLTGSGTNAVLNGEYAIITGNSFGNNQCQTGNAATGGDIAIGNDGTSQTLVQNTIIANNQMVGGNPG